MVQKYSICGRCKLLLRLLHICFFNGMQNVSPVSMHTAVRANLLPLLDAGWNSPIRSIAMNSIDWVVMRSVHFLTIGF